MYHENEIDVSFIRYRHPEIRRSASLLLAGLLVLLLHSGASAQQLKGVGGRYHPLNQQTQPGTHGYWSAVLNPQAAHYHQPVRIELPSAGEVSIFSGPAQRCVSQPAPAVAGVAVGHLYRVRIGEMPEFPGVDLFPTIEILDRLHPPEGRLFDFPVPIPITAAEIELALAGNLVTKVIYLEQPQLAVARRQSDLVSDDILTAHRNAFAEADRRGRPMVILRLGGRVPSQGPGDAEFFGTGAKITLPPRPAQTPATGRNESSRRNRNRLLENVTR